MPLELTTQDINLKNLGFSKILLVTIIKNQEDIEKSGAIILIDTNNEAEAVKLINKAHAAGKAVIIQARDISFNRMILENKKVKILLSPEGYSRNDSLYERNSGLNHILCKIAKENSTIIAISLKPLIEKEAKEKAEYLSRIIQNIKLCKKYKVPLILTMLPSSIEQARDTHSLKALARILGMDTKMAEISIDKTFLEKL